MLHHALRCVTFISTLVIMLGSTRILSSCWVFASDSQKSVIRIFRVSQTNAMQGAASYCEPAFRLVWPNIVNLIIVPVKQYHNMEYMQGYFCDCKSSKFAIIRFLLQNNGIPKGTKLSDALKTRNGPENEAGIHAYSSWSNS